jgi:thiamine-phosphate pyrophosphorylase
LRLGPSRRLCHSGSVDLFRSLACRDPERFRDSRRQNFSVPEQDGFDEAAYAEALPLRKAAQELGVLFIVNDRCDLALAVDADGVHLGQGDLPLDLARKVMGPDKLIGISTHSREQVVAATAGGPNYLGFGPIFMPGSKLDHDPVVGLQGLRAIRPLTALPIFAIGGITADRTDEVIRAGADGVAVISAILKAPDISQAVTDFVSRVSTPTSPGS